MCAVFRCCKELCGWCEPSIYGWTSYNSLVWPPTNSIGICGILAVLAGVLLLLTGFPSVTWFDGVQSPGFDALGWDTGNTTWRTLMGIASVGACATLSVLVYKAYAYCEHCQNRAATSPEVPSGPWPTTLVNP